MDVWFGKYLLKHNTSNQEQNLKVASSVQVSLLEVANNWKRGRDGSVWLAPAMSSCLECPYLDSSQLHPLIPSHWADAVRTINLPGWVPCHVLTAKTPIPHHHFSAKPHHRGWKTCQSYWLPWLWAHRDYGQTSDDIKHIMYSIQELLTISLFLYWGSNRSYCVYFLDLWCRCAVLERGREGVKKHFWIWDVNDKISWSCVRDQFQQIIFKRDSSKP